MTDLRERLGLALGDAFSLERELGGGGMSRVFLAEDLSLGRRVVVKVLPPELAESLNAERFRREIAVTARLQHPCIVPVLSAGVADGLPFYTMPFVPGLSLRQRIDAGALSTRSAIAILRDLAQALSFAHGAGVVHRDVKPENVLLYASTSNVELDDMAVVTDFGIAKAIFSAQAETGSGTAAGTLTQVGNVIGTPVYMSPEQAIGDAVDHRSDIYSWGIVAYEMLAGRPPFAGRSPLQLLAAHLSEVPLGLGTQVTGVPSALVSLVMHCLGKEPLDRPASMAVVIRALEELTLTDDLRSPDASMPATSIAVVPFVNLSADQENEYFSDGIAEEILGLLASDRTLRVAARSSSFAFKGQGLDSRTIAARLQVSRVLEGSVRRMGNRVRISAQLVDAGNGYQLWSGRFDRELDDVFAVQDEIAAAIAGTLAKALRPSPGDARTQSRHARQPASAGAYDAYLQGLHANHRRSDGMQEARSHFERALAIDPEMAAAHAGLAKTYIWFGMYNALPPSEAFPLTRRHAEYALSLDADLADAYHSLAYVALWWDRDPGACERHVLRALAIEPHHPEALILAAHFYNVRGRRPEALAATALALQADPIGIGTRIGALINYYLAREHRTAISVADALLADVPSLSEALRFRAMNFMAIGEFDAADRDMTATLMITGRTPWVLMYSGIVHAMSGRRGTTEAIRDELRERSESEWIPPLAIGHIEQILGNYDAAFAAYELAYRGRDFLLAMMHVDPSFVLIPPSRTASIAEDPRWDGLISRIGMAS